MQFPVHTQVAIGMHRNGYMTLYLENRIPALLSQYTYVTHPAGLYWHFAVDGRKQQTELEELVKCLHGLAQSAGPVYPNNARVWLQEDAMVGAMIIGDKDGDGLVFGIPEIYGIQLNRYLYSPLTSSPSSP